MKARSLAYWITTLVFALAILASGIADLVHAPAIVEGIGQLGYPLYLVTLLGVWKLLGVAAILAPGTPRLKEWAYAGLFFELTGAAFSHVAAGVGSPAAALALTGLAAASWALRPGDRRVPGPLALGLAPRPLTVAPG